jgi:hypothetical protein
MVVAAYLRYTAKNAQVDEILMKTGLNNVLLPTSFIAHIVQVQTTWAAKHCSVLLSNGFGVFCRVEQTQYSMLNVYLVFKNKVHKVQVSEKYVQTTR